MIAATLVPAWPDTEALIGVLVTVLSYNGAANALNDYFDYPADKVNRPGRPLPRGGLRRGAALWLAVILFAIGSLFALHLRPLATAIAVLIALPLMAFYSPVLKGLALVDNAIIAALLGLTFLFAGAAFGQLPAMWPPAGLAFGFNLLRELVKDIEDLEGDEGVGVRTFPVRYGAEAAIKLALILTLILMFGCLLPYILGVYNSTYLAAVIIGVEIPLLYAFNYLVKHPTPAGAGWVAKVLKVDIFAGLLAIYLSGIGTG
ncbi:MAG: geranylgeranylglycerol-phosphate geranylgeranyltransferase [Candidatus Marinimicrobia bacterium]|nr:geranylgeranylglycerol-phosphate geranylgeranyltransferase [Candidatus Neomarinimicrobiota bacterium]